MYGICNNFEIYLYLLFVSQMALKCFNNNHRFLDLCVYIATFLCHRPIGIRFTTSKNGLLIKFEAAKP